MNGRPSRIRSVSLLLALVLLGCGSSDGTSPPVVTITLTPSTLALFLGETGALIASTSGASGLTVQFSSSSTTVATVAQSGLVTAVGAGTATISASVVGRSGVDATAQVTVTGPQLELRSIQQNGEDVDLSQISGVVEVTIDHELGPAPQGVLELLVDGEVAVSVEIGQPSSTVADLASSEREPGSTTLVWNTAELDEDLDPIWGNDDRAILGRATAGIFGAPVESSPITGTLNNADGFFFYDIDAERKIADPQDFDWLSDNLTLRGKGISFGEEPIEDGAATLLLEGQGGLPDILTEADLSDAFVDFVVPSEATDGLEGEFLATTVSVVPAAGPPVVYPVLNDREIYFDGPDPLLWFDAKAPESDAFVLAEDDFWTNGTPSPEDFSFEIGFRFGQEEGNTVTDGGSGAPGHGEVGCDFHGGEEADPKIQPRLGFNYEPLGATPAPVNFFVAHCFDPIGNEFFEFLLNPEGDPVLFGLDILDPEASLVVGDGLVTDREVNPLDPAAIAWTATDNASGVDASNWRVGFRFAAAGVSAEDGCVEGLFDDLLGTCKPVAHLGVAPADRFFPVQGDPEYIGYWYSFVRPTDNAGNLGEQKEVVTLNDSEAPGLVDVLRPGEWIGGAGIEVSATLLDNVDLLGSRNRYELFSEQSYTWSRLFPINTPFSGTPVGSADITFGTDFFVNSVQQTLPFSGAPTGFGSKVKFHTLEVYDAAENLTSDRTDISDDVGGQFTPNLGTDIASMVVEISSLGVCVLAAPLCPPELTVTITVVQDGIDADPELANFLPLAKYAGLVISQPAGAPAASASADEDVWQSLEEFVTSQTLSSENVDATTVHTIELVIAGAGMPLGLYESRILGINSDGNALSSQSNFFTVIPGG